MTSFLSPFVALNRWTSFLLAVAQCPHILAPLSFLSGLITGFGATSLPLHLCVCVCVSVCVCVCLCVKQEGGEHMCVEQMRKDLERIKILRKKTFNFKRIEHCHQKGSHRPFSPICTFTKGKLRPTRGGSRAGSCRAKS